MASNIQSQSRQNTKQQPIRALLDLTQETALIYEEAMQFLDSESLGKVLGKKLMSFWKDQHRHLEQFVTLLGKDLHPNWSYFGFRTALTKPEPKVINLFGRKRLLDCLCALFDHEGQTLVAYQNALVRNTDPRSHAVLRSGYDDTARHVACLKKYLEFTR